VYAPLPLQVAGRPVSFPMTLRETFDPDFKVTTFEVEHLKTVRFRDNVTTEH